MMFAKTVCNNPGSYVSVVPFGLVARLQYNQNGLIEKILIPRNNEYEPLDNAQFKAAIQYVPSKVSLSGGTTWVDGVFYTEKLSTAPGDLPECTFNDYISRLGNESFTFYAGHIESLAASFQGILPTKNWLLVNKFNILPGIIIPLELKDEILVSVMNQGGYNFKYPYISGFMIFSNTTYEYKPAGLKQATAKFVSKILDENGYVKGVVKTTTGELKLNYSDIATYNIQTASSILYSNTSALEVLDSVSTDNKVREAIKPKMVCPACKKQYMLPKHGPSQCDDINCISRMYPNVKRLLDVLKLKEMPFDRFKSAIEDKEILCLTDVLLLPEYKEANPVATVSQAIKAVTPALICADNTFFDKFANSCSNSVETVMYYISNPLRIQTDLNITSIQGQRFIEWAQLPENALTLQTIFTLVKIRAKTNKFDGAPIFRGKSFVITGAFKHGNYDTIVSILESYSGIVYPDITDTLPDSVIVGSLKNGIDGNIVQKARFNGIPVFEEDDFFQWHKIDNDLAENLL